MHIRVSKRGAKRGTWLIDCSKKNKNNLVDHQTVFRGKWKKGIGLSVIWENKGERRGMLRERPRPHEHTEIKHESM
jgi:hypothetical protein